MTGPADNLSSSVREQRWTVHGKVQGVGFRMFVLDHALRSGLSGYVRNLDDGAVEVVAKGVPGMMEKLEAALRVGPRGARVERVEVSAMPDGAETPSPFEVWP